MSVSMADRLRYVRMRQEGRSAESIRQEMMRPQEEAFNERIQETAPRVQGGVESMQNLQPFVQRAAEMSFLAAAKAHEQSLRGRVQELQKAHKGSKEAEVTMKQEYAQTLAHQAQLREQLEAYRKAVKNALPPLPAGDLFNKIGKKMTSRIGNNA